MRQDADRARAKELFAKMTAREKVNHIFGYYWLHMVVSVFVLIVAVAFIASWRSSVATRDFLYIGLQDECYYALEPRTQTLAEQAQWPEGLNVLSFPSSQSEDGMGSMQLAMYLTADELDFIVCDEDTMQMLTLDESMNCTVTPLEKTRLGQGVESEQGWFVLTLKDTGRSEKVQRFLPVLMGDAS